MVDIILVILLIALLYLILHWIMNPWTFPLFSKKRKIQAKREYIWQVEEARAAWPLWREAVVERFPGVVEWENARLEEMRADVLEWDRRSGDSNADK